MKLANKIALITGAGSGMGRIAAVLFAAARRLRAQVLLLADHPRRAASGRHQYDFATIDAIMRAWGTGDYRCNSCIVGAVPETSACAMFWLY